MKAPGDKVDDLLGLDAEGREVRLSDYPGKKNRTVFLSKRQHARLHSRGVQSARRI